MLGDISPQTVRITQQAVVYTGRDHVTSLRVERFDGRTYKPVDMTAVTRVILSFPEADPVIVYDSSVQAVFTHVGTTLTVDLSDYAMPASVLGCQIILYDAEHPAGQVLVDDIDAVVQFDFRNVHMTGGTPPPAVEYITDAPIDGVTYARKDGLWVPVDALVSGVSSVNGQSGVVVLDAADVGADPVGAGETAASAAVAAHTALADPHPQYLTPAEGNAAYDASGAAASAVSVHIAQSDPHPQYLTPAEGNAAYDASGAATAAVSAHTAASDPHPQYNTQAEGDARYERGLTAGANITIDRTNPAAPVISASGGGGGGAVDSVNGQTGVVVLDAADVGADAAGTAAAAVAAHVAAANPHPEYLTPTEADTAYAPAAHVGAGGVAHSNVVAAGAAGFMTGADKTKLDGIAAGATANANTDSLSEGSTNKYFTELRVLATLMTGLTLIAGGAVSAADSLLVAVGKLQKQINDLFSGKQDTLVSATNIKTVNGSSLLGSGDLAVSGGASLPAVQTFTGAKNLALTDINTYNVSQDATPQAVTLPAQATVAWTDDAEIHIEQGAAGAVTVTGAAGVTINDVASPSILLFARGAVATLKRKGSNNWTLVGAIGTPADQRAALSVREQLTASRTYYVRTDGSDSNTGLVNTAGGAFRTIQKAVDVSAGLDLGVYNVIIRCTGSFTSTVTLKTLTGAGNIEIRGDASNTTDFSVAVVGGDCFSFGSGFLGLYKLHYMKLSTTSSGRCIGGSGGGGSVNYGNIDFGACAAAHISVSQGQYCAVDGPITISGPAGSHIQAFDGGSVRENNTTVTITGTPAFTQFASAGRSGTLIMSGNTYVGAATGLRYNATLNGVIFVNGAGDTYLPGDTAGVTATGGQYA